MLPVQTNRTVLELSSLVVTNAASDPDLPANVLTYSLLNPPAGAQKQYVTSWFCRLLQLSRIASGPQRED